MRIVSLAPSNTEIIYSLGLQNKLIATTSLCDFPEEALEKENIGGWTRGIDFDKIRDEEPEIVLASDSLQDEAVKELEGLEVMQVKPQTVKEVYESIREIGERLNAEDEAEKTIREMKEGLEDLEVEGNPRIYCEEWMEPPMASGNWIPGLIEKIGGEYFIDEGERSQEFDIDDLKEFDPEYIFLNVCGAGENIDVQEVMERPEWQQLTAVENGDVYVIDDALLNRPGPRLVEGTKRIVEKISEEKE